MKILGAFVLIYFFQALAGLLSVGLFLIFCLLKKKICHMDEAKWEVYFQGLSEKQYGYTMVGVLVLSLVICAFGAYFVFRAFGFTEPVWLSFFVVAFGTMRFGCKMKKQKGVLFEKIEKLRGV